jgi:hypothetical protein
MKPREQSFNEWIEYFARTDGTIAIDYFLGQIRDVCSIKRKPYCWVIASIDSVQSDTDGPGITIIGRAVPFAPSRYRGKF